jgi:hypothetical protein
VAGSDLDIACEVADLDAFAHRAEGVFVRLLGFCIVRTMVKEVPSLVVRFAHCGFAVELFGQPRPVEAQSAYRHLLVEARLLALDGPQARIAIRRLKQNGLKTEPAFARYFNLRGDPYEVLYHLSHLDDRELCQAINKELLQP